jgi:hypothetical protein
MTKVNQQRGLAMVAAKASATILTVMQRGQEKYGDSWRTRDDQTDLDQAKQHLERWEAVNDSEDLEHALTRLALILARQRK